MDDWKKFNKTSLPEKEDFYIHLNMEDITDADYTHKKIVHKDFEINKLGEYHDLYVQSDTLFLGDAIDNFQNMCLEICKLGPPHFLYAPRLTWQRTFKKTKVKKYLSTDTALPLVIEKGIRGGMCHSVYRYAKVNNKYIEVENHHIFNNGM